MSIVDVLKKPVVDVGDSFHIIKNLKELNKEFKQGKISELVYNKKTKTNQLKLLKSATPLMTSALIVASYGVLQGAFQNDIPFEANFTEGGNTLAEFIKLSFSEESNKQFVDGVDLTDFDSVKNYTKYISSGVSTLVAELKYEHLPVAFLASVGSLYALMNGVTGTIDFLAGTTSTNLREIKNYDAEMLKLQTLRKHYHDPVFENLNNEEMFTMMVSFNNSLKKHHVNDSLFIKKAITVVDQLGDWLVKPARKMFNSSTNEKSNLTTSIFNYIERGIDFKNPSNTFKDYGISEYEFNALAAKSHGKVKKDQLSYIFDINNKAMKTAYRTKLKDDTILSFSLSLANIVKKGSVDEDDIDDMKKYKLFIDDFENNDILLKGQATDPDLVSMKKIIDIFTVNTERIKPLLQNERHKDYTNFLSKHAPHLINRSESENKIFINNYTFLNYYEAEKKRLVQHDRIKNKIDEYRIVKEKANEGLNLYRVKECDEKIKALEHSKLYHNNIFGKKTLDLSEQPDDFIYKKDSRVSSSFIDPTVKNTVKPNKDGGVKTFILNFLAKEEEELLSGQGLREKGIRKEVIEKSVMYKDITEPSEEEKQNEIKQERAKNKSMMKRRK